MARLVRVNSLGLVIPPQRLDCLGEKCPVAQKIGRCFVDEHHLYFPLRKFAQSELSLQFREHPFNRIKLSRCQHNSKWRGSIHKSRAEAPMPQTDVMRQFLDEAMLLQELGVLSIKSDGLLQALSREDTDGKTRKRREMELESTNLNLHCAVQLAKDECEVTLQFLERQPDTILRAFGATALTAIA